jgi:hypothetical protein
LVIYPNGFYSDNTVVIPALDQIGVRYLVSYFVFALHILPLLKSLRVFFPLQINIAEANGNCKYLFNIFLYFFWWGITQPPCEGNWVTQPCVVTEKGNITTHLNPKRKSFDYLLFGDFNRGLV